MTFHSFVSLYVSQFFFHWLPREKHMARSLWFKAWIHAGLLDYALQCFDKNVLNLCDRMFLKRIISLVALTRILVGHDIYDTWSRKSDSEWVSNIPGNFYIHLKHVLPCVATHRPTYSINHSWNQTNRLHWRFYRRWKQDRQMENLLRKEENRLVQTPRSISQ